MYVFTHIRKVSSDLRNVILLLRGRFFFEFQISLTCIVSGVNCNNLVTFYLKIQNLTIIKKKNKLFKNINLFVTNLYNFDSWFCYIFELTIVIYDWFSINEFDGFSSSSSSSILFWAKRTEHMLFMTVYFSYDVIFDCLNTPLFLVHETLTFLKIYQKKFSINVIIDIIFI